MNDCPIDLAPTNDEAFSDIALSRENADSVLRKTRIYKGGEFQESQDGRHVILFLAADPKVCATKSINSLAPERIEKECSEWEKTLRGRINVALSGGGKTVREKLIDEACKAGRAWLVGAFHRGASIGISHMLRSAEETCAVDNALLQKECEAISFEKFFCVNKTSLMNRIKQFNPSVLHFSSHGKRQGKYVSFLFHDGAFIGAMDFCAEMKMMHVHVNVAVLAACHSALLAKRLTDDGIATWAIGANGTIADEKIIAFTRCFYLCLLKSGSDSNGGYLISEVRTAYNDTLKTLKGKIDMNDFSLYPLEGAGENVLDADRGHAVEKVCVNEVFTDLPNVIKSYAGNQSFHPENRC